MDEIEKRLYHDLQEEIDTPKEYENIIKEGLNKKKRCYSLTKIVTTACASLVLTAGIVYAGTTVIEKIWKQPEKIVGIAKDNTITKEELEKSMSEKEARKKAEKILEQFGYKEEKIKSIELQKNVNNKLDWYIETENNIYIYFDATGGKELYISSDGMLEKDIKNYHTTKEKAEQTARILCDKYGYDLQEYNYVEVDSNMESEEKSYIWYVNFYKESNKIVNKYNGINIAFIPEINKLYYFIIKDEKFENNTIQITEEQAKKIALGEEQKIDTKYNIKNTQTELSIAEMNGDAYARITDYKQFYEERNTLDYPNEKQVEYRTEGRIRKVWKVKIKYDVPLSDMFTDDFNVTDIGYTYYIDATTGEIIGGEAYNKPIITKYENNQLVVIDYID